MVGQLESEHFAALLEAHDSELQGVRGETRPFHLRADLPAGTLPLASAQRAISPLGDVLRMHFANRALPWSGRRARRQHHPGVLLTGLPVATWLSSKSALLRRGPRCMASLLGESGHGRLAHWRTTATRLAWPRSTFPLRTSDVQSIVDSMFLNGSLHPLAVELVPAGAPGWIKADCSGPVRQCNAS